MEFTESSLLGSPPRSAGCPRRAERLRIDGAFALPVAQTRDSIGPKIQAAKNDPARTVGDWHDIHSLVEDDLRLFGLDDRLPELKSACGPRE